MASNTNVNIPQYASKMGVAIPGMLYGTSDHIVLTKQAAASADIAFGAPLFATSADAHKVVATDSTKALPLVGVAGFTHNEEGCYPAGQPLNCVAKGFIYVKMASTISEGEAVYVKYADGKFYSATAYAAGTSDDFVALGAKAVTAGAAVGDIVPVFIG